MLAVISRTPHHYAGVRRIRIHRIALGWPDCTYTRLNALAIACALSALWAKRAFLHGTQEGALDGLVGAGVFATARPCGFRQGNRCNLTRALPVSELNGERPARA